MSLDRVLSEIEQTLGEGTLAVAARFLPTGETVSYNADTVSPTASVIKAVIVAEWLAQCREGRQDRNTVVAVEPEQIVGGSGVLGLLDSVRSPGLRLPVSDLATLAVSVSDNTASNLVLRQVGGADAVNRRMEAWGMTNTRIHRPIRFALGPGDPPYTATGTPSDLLRFLSAVGEKRLHSEAVSDAVQTVLGTCQDETLLPRYLTVNPYADALRVALPPFTIAHKTGAVTGVRNDVALITRAGQTLAVAVFTSGCPDPTWTPANRGSEAVARVGKLLCDHFFGA